MNFSVIKNQKQFISEVIEWHAKLVFVFFHKVKCNFNYKEFCIITFLS